MYIRHIFEIEAKINRKIGMQKCNLRAIQNLSRSIRV